MAATPISSIASAVLNQAAIDPTAPGGQAHAASKSFSQMLLDGVDRADQKLKAADSMVTAFALDDSIPPHQVMFALEQAHHSLEALMQVRARLVESYQELMRMQL